MRTSLNHRLTQLFVLFLGILILLAIAATTYKTVFLNDFVILEEEVSEDQEED